MRLVVSGRVPNQVEKYTKTHSKYDVYTASSMLHQCQLVSCRVASRTR